LAALGLQAEVLECRTLLSISIPSAIDSGEASQVLFAGDVTRESIAAGHADQLMEFALKGVSSPQTVRFDLAPDDPTNMQDAALALYDADGNLIASADNNPKPAEPGLEVLTASVSSAKPYVLGVFRAQVIVQGGFHLDVTPGPQAVGPTITANPSTGQASLGPDSGETVFQSNADVEIYPIDLPNGGASDGVTVTPVGVGLIQSATLFQRSGSNSPWIPIDFDDGAGPLALSLNPPPRAEASPMPNIGWPPHPSGSPVLRALTRSTLPVPRWRGCR
jgi:hypothetical protein